MGVARAMLVSDRGVIEAGITERVRAAIEVESIEVELFDRVRVEPTDESMQEAADFALDGGFDGFVGVGGGSCLDTAKVADLVATHPAAIMDYVNHPVGGGRKPPSPLKPLLAIPTTAGTGSEATSVAVLDIPEQRVKSGISHRYLRPAQGIVDPELTRTTPAAVTAACGLDVICHAAESYVARAFDSRDRPEIPRPPALPGLEPRLRGLVGQGARVRRALPAPRGRRRRRHGGARGDGGGRRLGSAGVHIPHACAYPTASLKHEWQPPGYEVDHPFVPHGFSVMYSARRRSGTPTVAIRRSTPTSRGGSPLRSRSRPPTSMPRPSRHCCGR